MIFLLFFSHTAYLVLITPLSIVRFIEFRDNSVGFQAVVAVGFIWALSGLVDVILYLWVKPAFGGVLPEE